MDLKWFLKYLTLTRWSKLLAVFLACVFFGIVAMYFMFLQSSYRQHEWNFKNASFIKHTMTLDSGRIYKVSWENEYKTTPYVIDINGKKVHTVNYLKMRYIHVEYSYHCPTYLTNPFHVRVNKATEFGLSFMVRTTVRNIGDGFFESWLESFIDPINKATWKVQDVTESYNQGKLTIDGSFPIK